MALAALVTTTGCSKEESTTGTSSRPGCEEPAPSTGNGGGGTGSGDAPSGPTGPGDEGGGEEDDEGGGLVPQAAPCGSTSSSSNSGNQSGASSSGSESFSFCLGDSGWTCPTASAKEACLKGSCGSCTKRDPAECKDTSSGDDEEDDED